MNGLRGMPVLCGIEPYVASPGSHGRDGQRPRRHSRKERLLVHSANASLLGLNRQEVAELIGKAGEPSYRVQQIMNGVYRERVQALDQISTLPRLFREDLSQNGLAVVSPGFTKRAGSGQGR